jgi:Flp pilus assembly protein TadD
MPNVSEMMQKGKLLLYEGNFEDALSFFEQAVILEPNNPEIWNQKGSALRSLGRYDEALDCFNRALELEPSDKRSS